MRAAATLTPLMDDITIARRNRRKLECMIVIDDLVLGCGVADALPRILLDVDVRLLDVPVFVEEVLGERERKVFGRFDAVLFGQQVDGVLLRVGRNDIRVITCQTERKGKAKQKQNCQFFVCHAHFPIKMDGFDGVRNIGGRGIARILPGRVTMALFARFAILISMVIA